jgi:hypothetical protein
MERKQPTHLHSHQLTYIELASLAREDIFVRDHVFTAFAPAIPAELD